MSIINMQTMRYINLLDRISRVKTSKCYIYNNTIVFAVPRHLISKAIGRDAENIRMIQDQLGRRVKIINEPNGLEDLPRFVHDIVIPAKFKEINVANNEIVITAGSAQNKASLLGRNKKRYDELREILQGIFNLDIRIT